MAVVLVGLIAGLLATVAGCQAGSRPIPLLDPLPPTPLLIPQDVHHIAVLYPKPTSPDMADAYNRLEGAIFRLKAHRPTLQIIDRFHSPIVLAEHRFQLAGAVAEESAIRIGCVLGVDTVLIRRIDGPSNRDRIWARSYRDLPP